MYVHTNGRTVFDENLNNCIKLIECRCLAHSHPHYHQCQRKATEGYGNNWCWQHAAAEDRHRTEMNC